MPLPNEDNHERFMRLLLEHEPAILRSVLMFVPQRADARDVVQETAVALWKHFAEYDAERSFAAWACGFARMEVRRFLRRAQRRMALSEKAVEALMLADETEAAVRETRERELADCLTRLPEEQRQLVEGYYFEERPVDALARVQGRTIEAIYKSLQRIRHALLDCLERKLREAEA